MLNLNQNRHPSYLVDSSSWAKWRLAYLGGRDFVIKYLRQYSSLETTEEFQNRTDISYSPSFTRPEIKNIINKILAVMPQIQRTGSSSYIRAADGGLFGVDNRYSPWEVFCGEEVLPELLVMGSVGVCVDMIPEPNPIMSEMVTPYLYTIPREDILNWAYDRDRLVSVIYKTTDYAYDDKGFPTGYQTVHRMMQQTPNGVLVVDETDGSIVERVLEINRLPFVILKVSDSLMRDIADYQVALLNIASSDLAYVLQANFPFLTVQQSKMQKWFEQQAGRINEDGTEQTNADEAKIERARIGTRHGLFYEPQLERPNFIHPSPEPLEASMKKQEQLKQEIKLLLNRSLIELQGVSAGERTRRQAEESPEQGLKSIGQVLQAAETDISKVWAEYMGEEPVTILYPDQYSTLTDEELNSAIRRYRDTLDLLPSTTYKKEIGKQLAEQLLKNLNTETRNKIAQEIDSAVAVVSNPDVLQQDSESGFVSKELASKLRGYPAGEAEKAREEHLERLKEIAAAQAPGGLNANRGVDDLGDGPDEKDGKPVRGAERGRTQSDPNPVDSE